MAASSPTVVPEACSIARTSFCSCAWAVEIAELDEVLDDPSDELLDEPLDELEVFELLAVLAAAVAVVSVEVDVEVCAWWCAWTRAAT
jgi:hypothetical protein